MHTTKKGACNDVCYYIVLQGPTCQQIQKHSFCVIEDGRQNICEQECIYLFNFRALNIITEILPQGHFPLHSGSITMFSKHSANCMWHRLSYVTPSEPQTGFTASCTLHSGHLGRTAPCYL